MADESSLFQWIAGIVVAGASGVFSWSLMRIWQRIDGNEVDIKDIREKYVRRDDLAEHIRRIEDSQREIKLSVDTLTRAVLKLVHNDTD